jgi:hypothetical protein
VAQFSVIYDACVLYLAPLRDLLMQLALTDLGSIPNQLEDTVLRV